MRTVAQAIEDVSRSTTTGVRFLDETREPRWFSHEELGRETARWGGALQAIGLKKGDRVALILPDNLDFIFCFLGAVRAGIIPVPIYPPTGLGALAGYLENTLHVVDRCGARMLITSSDVKLVLGAVRAGAPNLERMVNVDELKNTDAQLRPEKISLDDTCFLQFTSGSTSRPKGVVLTHGNLAANIRCIMEKGQAINSRIETGVSWLPLYHDMGLIGFVLAPLFHSVTITFMPPLLFLKRPARWLHAISEYSGAGSISFGPNFAYALATKRIKDTELAGVDLSAWRVAGCGAEPIRAETLRAFANRFGKVGFSEEAFMCSYGMAENTLAISFSAVGKGIVTDSIVAEGLWTKGLAQPAPAPGNAEGDAAGDIAAIVACGEAFEDHAIAAFSLDDRESLRPLPERQVGELRLQGPSVTAGYYNEPELTAEAWAGKWFRTGDLGYLADGKVFVCGRSKEVIIHNGRNYYPQDLEWEASKVEGVRKGNVIAFGTMQGSGATERVVVVLETSLAPEAHEALCHEVRRTVQQGVGLTVDDVVAVAAGVLPKTSSGKLQRTKTRSLYETGEIRSRKGARDVSAATTVKEVAKSQLSYFKHAIFGAKSE